MTAGLWLELALDLVLVVGAIAVWWVNLAPVSASALTSSGSTWAMRCMYSL